MRKHASQNPGQDPILSFMSRARRPRSTRITSAPACPFPGSKNQPHEHVLRAHNADHPRERQELVPHISSAQRVGDGKRGSNFRPRVQRRMPDEMTRGRVDFDGPHGQRRARAACSPVSLHREACAEDQIGARLGRAGAALFNCPNVTIWRKRYADPFSGSQSPVLGTVCSGSNSRVAKREPCEMSKISSPNEGSPCRTKRFGNGVRRSGSTTHGSCGAGAVGWVIPGIWTSCS